jgi:hypothetical protein
MWKYKGGGFIPGVPARDITEQEYEQLDAELQKAVRESGLYEQEKQVQKKQGPKGSQEA